MNNLTELKSSIPIEVMKKIIVGDYTYGLIDVRLGGFENLYIKIGSYVSIASEVEFICGMDHNINHMSNYPFGYYGFYYCNSDIGRYFKNKQLEIHNLENKNKGPIIVDDDVWIGTGVKIMSGVHIGQGAVIAAGAVVTRDVPPYAVVGGVPAKVIKYRFSEDKIKKLLQIDYTNTPLNKFLEIYPETIKEDFDIDYILKKLNKRGIKGE